MAEIHDRYPPHSYITNTGGTSSFFLCGRRRFWVALDETYRMTLIDWAFIRISANLMLTIYRDYLVSRPLNYDTASRLFVVTVSCVTTEGAFELIRIYHGYHLLIKIIQLKAFMGKRKLPEDEMIAICEAVGIDFLEVTPNELFGIGTYEIG